MDLDVLDRALAEKVMGWHITELYEDGQLYRICGGGYAGQHWADPAGKHHWLAREWHPTRNELQALAVFKRCSGIALLHRGGEFAYVTTEWDIETYTLAKGDWTIQTDTLELAICLAAAKKYGIEVT